MVGYYALAVGSVERAAATSKARRNAPEFTPVIVLARLAVHEAWQNCGIGKGMLKDAVLRILETAKTAGICALLVHAVSDRAKQFYLKFRFTQPPPEKMTLTITLAEAEAQFTMGGR